MTDDEKIVCAQDDCENEFVRTKPANKKYCSPECCRIQTNRKIMEKYYQKRAQLRGEERICNKCQVTKLSRYNEKTICSSCETEANKARNRSVLNMVLNSLA